MLHARGRARAVGVRRSGLGGRLGLKRRPCSADSSKSLRFVGHPARQLVTTPINAVLLALYGIGTFGACKPSVDLSRESDLGLPEPSVAHGFVSRSIGSELRAINGHVPKPHQARCTAEQQDLQEEARQGGQVPFAGVADCAEIGPVQPGDRHESIRSSQARAIRLEE
jgi:hypothetical protein